MSDVIGKGVIEVSADATKMKAGIDDAKRSIRSLGEANRDASTKASQSIDRYIKRLESQNVTLGKSTRETKLYELSLRGASKAQLAAADSALRFQENSEKGARGIASLKTGFIAAAAASAVVLASMARLAKGTIDSADAMGKLSQKTGISVEQLSAFEYAGSLADVSLESLSNSFKKLSVNMNMAATNATGEAASAFRAIGVSVKTSTGDLRNADEVFGDIANRFAEMEDGAGKTALAVAIFGKAGADLIPMLNGGAEGLREARKEAEEFGLILSGDLAKASEEFNDNLTRIQSIGPAFGMVIANDMLPWISRMAEEFLTARKNGLSFLDSMIEIGLRMPGNSYRDNIRGIDEEIARLQVSAKGYRNVGDAVKAAEAEKDIARKKSARAYFAERERAEALKGGDNYGNEARGVTAVTTAKKKAPTFGTESGASGIKKISAIDVFDNMSFITHDKEVADFIREQTKAVNELSAAMVQDGIKAADEYSKKLNSLISNTPIEQTKALEENISFLDEAFMSGSISAEQHGQAIDQLTGKMVELKDTGKDAFDELKTAIEGWGKQAADAIVQFTLTGKMSFSDMAQSILADIAKMLVYKYITGPLFDSISSFLPGATASVKHTGSGPGDSQSAYRTVSISDFAGAPRYHSGIGPREEAAIIRKDESVLTPGQMRQLAPVGSSGTNVIINVVESPGKGGQQQTRTEGGTKIIDVFVEQVKAAIAGDIARGSGAIPNALSGTYGLNRVAGAY